MKKLILGTFTAALVAAPFHVSAAPQDNGNDKEEYLIQFDGPAEAGLLNAFGVDNEDILHEYNYLPVHLVELTEEQAEAMEKHPHVAALDENAEVHTLQDIPYGIEQVQSLDVQGLGFRGQGMSVAVLDTGIDINHQDLYDNIQGGYSVFTDSANSNPFYDENGHGTHVAGTVAALDNDIGVLGAAPEADLYAVKVLSNEGSGSLAGIAEGIEWSIANDIDIINMSLGGSQGSSILEEFTDLAYQEGSLVVAAAGNSGKGLGFFNTVGYPAQYDSAIAVAAVDANNNTASFSSAGPAVEISAPGVDIRSTTPGNNYQSFNGTSMAAPHVAGVAAQVWQARPELSNSELRELLNSTALPLGSARDYGNGLIQAADAVNN
ncbi:S8 family peptidase [Alkalicoccus daliensis]|uniref:Subtilisin n=1 Tax=Alkalicoccus daliensis TaxID=745820 RepID=A0A1H0HTE8_9BACI|nr:S8 family peptidase [Alkalicoccus daliensis]SDO22413.1 subtilisin [Alkalicoccus daliensis]